ncbi:MAG: hypothetical protein HY543_01025 [Deltaproteobacteria bacterium]|nr:hypothetical protein [Deltaproteobacteria bacterium]
MMTTIKSSPLPWRVRLETSAIRLSSAIPQSPPPPVATTYLFANGTTWKSQPPPSVPITRFVMAAGNGGGVRSPAEETAKQAMRRHQYNIAIEGFQRALTEQAERTNKLSGVTLCDLGICFRNVGRRTDAIQALTLANQWNEHSRTWCELCITHREACDFAAARTAIHHAIRIEGAQGRVQGRS